MTQAHRGRCILQTGRGAQALKRPWALVLAFGLQNQRFDVAVEEFLLLVGQGLELLEDTGELGVAKLEAEFLDALAQCMSAAVLAEHERRAGQADVLRPHDFVGAGVLQHAVLMNARFMREGVFTDDRLVPLHLQTGDR